jgi:hypothetical protein
MPRGPAAPRCARIHAMSARPYPIYNAGMRWLAAPCCWFLLACSASSPHAATTPDVSRSDEDALAAISVIHGGAGPWVVAGYRMGRFALARLHLSARSDELEVIHYVPREVQYSCIADGAAAATGASVGHLNLSLQDANAAATRTTYRNRSAGTSITLQVSPEFATRFTDVPPQQLAAAGREVLHLPDAAVFREVAEEPKPEH